MPLDFTARNDADTGVQLAAAADLFPGGGELGALIRDKDWSHTPLGPMAHWPQSLRTAVSMVVYSDFPMIILWGAELIQIYNDAYRLLMGPKHPSGLGQGNRECWPEVWHINETIYPRIFAGESLSFKEAMYPLAPFGVAETYYLTLSYSPVIDESGGVGGVFVTVFDVTSEVRTREERDRALAESRAGRERMSEVFMQTPAAVAVLEGSDHRFTLANPRYRAIVGNRDVVGKPLAEALPEIRGQGFIELLDGVAETAEPFVARDAPVMIDRDGNGALTEIFVDMVYQPLADTAGRVFGIMVHAVETTEQVLARRRVEALAVERRAILSQIADVVVVLDRDARISFLNEASRVIYAGLELGRTFAEQTVGITMTRVDGTPLTAADLPTARALRGERVVDEEWIVAHADGTQFRVEGSAVPVNDEAGSPLGVVLTVRDVTQQRLLQRHVEVERNRLAEVFQQAPALIAVLEGPEHLILTANPSFHQLVGGNRAIEGLTMRAAFPDLEGHGFFELLDAVYRTGEPFVGNEVLARLDRDNQGVMQDGYFNFVYQPLTGESGSTRGILVHAVEVTEQVLARRGIERTAAELVRLTYDLEQSNRELDQFAYVASHDLKAPLRGIANLAAWIEEDVGDGLTDDSREHLRLLKGRVHRMESLIDGILAYSRAGRVRVTPETVDTGALVREGVELLAPAPEVTVTIAPNMPVVEAERVPLQQVFMNLVGNAIKYAGAVRADVEVRVGWAAVNDGYEFTIADNGDGISPEYHDRIWGMFQTLQARDKVEGTGIGLSVVKKIVETRGGSVWVKSEPGAGATFHFTWPISPRGTPMTQDAP